MCGRYTLGRPPKDWCDALEIEGEVPAVAPRFNIAPTQECPIVVRAADGGGRRAGLGRWGWPNPAGPSGAVLINARSETAAVKRSFAAAFREHRCLVPADGFFEWPRRERRSGPRPGPVWFSSAGEGFFVFAGLLRPPENPGEPPGFVILTTTANELLAPLHDRMPVILDPNWIDVWLHPGPLPPEVAAAWVHPWPAEQMTARPVGPRVNRVSEDDPACLDPADPPPDGPRQMELF
ncbi:MAG: SOS response-associated peptidase [Puniceicoccaceae bacterium]|nr:MAG: SOS response-associated peptidase [Puniceicoccaceae bacterium]